MTTNRPRKTSLYALVLTLLLLAGLSPFTERLAAHSEVAPAPVAASVGGGHAAARFVQVPMSPSAACTGGTAPAVEGTTLPNCYQRNITIGGNARIIRVWYTTDFTSFPVDGQTYVHGVTGESQASDVADAVAESWQTVFNHSAIGGHTPREPYINGCSNVLNIQLRDGKGWAGIAYWGSPGNCNIGIDAPMISDGVGTDDDGVIFHEIQHYTQYSYNDGCYADFQPLYSSGNAWIEGWANWAGVNATNAATDASFRVSDYESGNSYYDLDYVNLHAGYLIQQYGRNGVPSDPAFGIKAVYEHYRQCDQYDDVFVMDETIQALTGGAKNEKWAFVDFQAAYYAYPFADPVTQPELVFPDADDKPTGTPSFELNMPLSSSISQVDSSPEDWTGKYYQFLPQASCKFVELHVETTPPGAEIGINFMAIKTSPASVQRSAHIGDSATRMFAGSPANNRLVINVASFDGAATYMVSAACVTPTINILEPIHNPGHAMVGAPNSPIATLTRFKVTSGGLPVSGITASTVTFDAEGAAATLVDGSFQEVGPGEYWAAIVPPTKPASTTFVDYKVCLNTSICDTETDALLYEDPGNSDTVYLFDESGSMGAEDTPGEGTRITNARRAGLVLADMLRPGDRVGIIGHGAANIPVSCGLPGGAGNCSDASITRLARINSVNVPADIATVKAGVNAVTDRPVWTNTGRGLLNAKDMLLAGPSNRNPDHIILLSDGQENVNPLYDTAAVRDVLFAAGVCVDTIGLGPEAPGALLAQIAAQNCGTYRPVPTSGLGTSRESDAELQASLNQLAAMGASPEMVETMSTAASALFYPGQLGIADANEYLDVAAEDSSRLFHHLHTDVTPGTYQTHEVQIDKSTRSFRFVVVGKQGEAQLNYRIVELLPPGAERWIPISPKTLATPADWDIRNDPYQDVVIVKDPAPGKWGFRTRYVELTSDFIMNLSAQTTIRLEGNLLNLTNGKAMAGDTVPIVATLMNHKGLLPGAAVAAVVYNEGGADLMLLLDDGNHHDGAAGDGIYGFPYSMTDHGGSYSVRIVTAVPDPNNPANSLWREWNGGFWVDGPQDQNNDYKGDSDGDGMPDDWERRCKLIVGQDDSKADNDRDGLPNGRELQLGTLPCDPDTDNGGERDGSEVSGQRNPLYSPDDKARKVTGITLRPLNAAIAVSWSQRANTHTNVLVCVSSVAGSLGQCQSMDGRDGDYLLRGLTNGQTYYLTLYALGADGAQGTYSNQMAVKPAADPIPPQGAFFIGGPAIRQGGDVAASRSVTLFIDAVDTDGKYDGPSGLGSHSVPHGLVTPDLAGTFEVSGNVQMRFANTQAGIASAKWESRAATKPWTLDCADGTYCTVYGQFRDGAGNESLIVTDRVLLKLEAPPPNAPSITRFAPTRGLVGATVTITGKNLSGATQVTFNQLAAASFTVVSASQIKAVVPVGATTGKIGVTTPNGSAVSAADFTVVPPRPTIISFSPTVGSVGTQVEIIGTNLGSTTVVRFGSKAAPPPTIISDEKILVVVPAGAKTAVISVTTLGGTAKSKAKFTVR